MRRFEKNFNLFEAAPNLIKEWHPTANSNLTPRNVKIINPKKVWWICNHGHEWLATIKTRIKGGGCPLCNKERGKSIHHDDKSISRKKLKGNKVFFLSWIPLFPALEEILEKPNGLSSIPLQQSKSRPPDIGFTLK